MSHLQASPRSPAIGAKKVITRFAPSPTGFLHIGNLRTALFNYLYAKSQGGSLLLRIEDSDMVRSKAAYIEGLFEDLNWFGIEWQLGPFYQSERQAVYENYFQKLEHSGQAYPCYCSEEDLAVAREKQLALKLPPRYEGTCQHLTEEERKAKEKAGIRPVLRFRVPSDATVAFTDLLKGDQTYASAMMGDFIIRRADGTASFLFCNAIDDSVMGVTHALRGEDHLSNTPKQLLILNALGLSSPEYGHFPMILGVDRAPLSKRNGSRSVRELRQEGYDALGVLNYLARLGHHYVSTEFQTLEDLSSHFDLARVSCAPAHFDLYQLRYWQKEAIQKMAFPAFLNLIMPQIIHFVPAAQRETFARLVQMNLVMPNEVLVWADAFFSQQIVYSSSIEKVLHEIGAPFFTIAKELIHSGVGSSELVPLLQERTGLNKKTIFLALRSALTAQIAGPELMKIIDMMGANRLLQRLRQAENYCASHL